MRHLASMSCWLSMRLTFISFPNIRNCTSILSVPIYRLKKWWHFKISWVDLLLELFLLQSHADDGLWWLSLQYIKGASISYDRRYLTKMSWSSISTGLCIIRIKITTVVGLVWVYTLILFCPAVVGRNRRSYRVAVNDNINSISRNDWTIINIILTKQSFSLKYTSTNMNFINISRTRHVLGFKSDW